MKICKTSSDSTRTNITVRGTHGSGGDTKDCLDGFTSPTQFTYNLLVGQTGQGLIRNVRSSPRSPLKTYTMRPGVDTDLMTGHVLFHKNLGVRDNTGPNNEEGGQKILLIEILQKGSVRNVSQHRKRRVRSIRTGLEKLCQWDSMVF